MDRNQNKKASKAKAFLVGTGTMVLGIVAFLFACQLLVVLVKLVIG